MKLIELDKLAVGYNGKSIISNISFTINGGDYIYIIGDNGVGKSTLVKGMLGLLKPLKGKVNVNNLDITKDIGYLPQISTSMQNFPASVYEVVLSGTLNSRGIKPTYSKENKEEVVKVLKTLKIHNLINKSFSELSGGQQRRVLLARAMCSTSKVLIMDEPITGLDPKASNDFYELIKKLNKDGMTIIMVSHDIKAAIKYGSKVLHIKAEDCFYGDIDSYKKNIMKEYLLEDAND